MEKKGSRSVQACSKGLATDSKKNQDGPGGKLWPRGGRRREPATSSFPGKNETSRKPVPQRNKLFDKRPKPRGHYYSGIVGGKEDTGLEEPDAELGSVFVLGSKKQSLNHLLNFHYQSREHHCHGGKSVTPKSGHRWLSTFKHKYNKELFLQANCQFIVKSSGNYKQYMNNPDTLVDWDLVEQVNVQVSECPSCPICLYPPVAAKMTRCGHIYCWSCLLHYLALSDKTSRKCPICFEPVHKQDLKSTVLFPHAAFNIKETITFKLMKRLRGSLVAYPADNSVEERVGAIFSMSEKEASSIHSKLLLANKAEVLSIINRERQELESQLAEDENCPEKCFIQEAITLLAQREACVFAQIEEANEPLSRAITQSLSLDADVKQFDDVENEFSRGDSNRVRFESVSSEDLNAGADANVCMETSTSAVQQPSKHFYFYQAADGQHIYLHALNARMLEHTYGSLEKSPKTVTGKIVEKEGGSMTEELRKRLRYLQHLPVTCQFEVAEIQLREPIVSKATLQAFYDQIETRRKRRQRRARDEKRREKRIQEEENRQLGKFPTANIHLDSPQQFPDFGLEPALTLQRTESESTPHSERSLSPVSGLSGSYGSNSQAGSLGMESEYAGPSFAKIVSSVKKPMISRPELKTEVTTPAARLISVTGAKTTMLRVKQAESDQEDEDYVPAPQFNRSFGDAIALALEKASIENESGIVPQSGKKKKKNKQKVLFATSMSYCGN